MHVYMYCWRLRGFRSNQSNPPRYGPAYDESNGHVTDDVT